MSGKRTSVYYDDFWDRMVIFEPCILHGYRYLEYNGGFIEFLNKVNKNKRLFFMGYL